MKITIYILLLLVIVSCKNANQVNLLEDLRILSSDEFEGRKPGTRGSIKAQKFIINRLSEIGAKPFKNSYVDSFDLKFVEGSKKGTNIQAIKNGGKFSEKLIVVSAHYDHLGISKGEIYNGANDNATGVSVLLNLISSLKNISTNHSILYLFIDAEEYGKEGVKHFLSNNIDLHEEIILNFNIDMLNCNSTEELYICGTKQNPILGGILENKVKELKINFGHDEDTNNKKSWVESSDHKEFANWGISFLYLGSENEDNYNTPQDDFQNINLGCFSKTLNITKELILELDQKLEY